MSSISDMSWSVSNLSAFGWNRRRDLAERRAFSRERVRADMVAFLG
jgi:hypothetical protein